MPVLQMPLIKASAHTAQLLERPKKRQAFNKGGGGKMLGESMKVFLGI